LATFDGDSTNLHQFADTDFKGKFIDFLFPEVKPLADLFQASKHEKGFFSEVLRKV